MQFPSEVVVGYRKRVLGQQTGLTGTSISGLASGAQVVSGQSSQSCNDKHDKMPERKIDQVITPPQTTSLLQQLDVCVIVNVI
jgi:hypothetical protein